MTTLVFQPSLAVWAQGFPTLPVGRGLLRALSWTLRLARPVLGVGCVILIYIKILENHF